MATTKKKSKHVSTTSKNMFRYFSRRRAKRVDHFQELSSSDENVSDDAFLPQGNALWTKLKNDYQTKVIDSFTQLKEKQLKNRVESNDTKETVALSRSLYDLMIPGLVKCLQKATDKSLKKNIKLFQFDPVDFLAEYMYKHNPEYPERAVEDKNIFDIDMFKACIGTNRGVIPNSWYWNLQDAVTVIQKHVRGWIVRKRKDVQEMRLFWKLLKDPSLEKKCLEEMNRFSEPRPKSRRFKQSSVKHKKSKEFRKIHEDRFQEDLQKAADLQNSKGV